MLALEARMRIGRWDGRRRIVARDALFQQSCVARLKRVPGDQPRVLAAYSYAAEGLLAYARTRGWRTVLCQIDPGPGEERLVAGFDPAAPLRSPETWERWRRECALADRIVVNSEWSRTLLLEEGIPAEKLRVVPLVYEKPAEAVSRRYPQHFDATRPLRALFLGQLISRKGLMPLFDAIRALEGLPVTFDIVGHPAIPIPADIAANPAVRLPGGVPHSATPALYRDADVFLFPTFSDGFGLTQLEAQAWRLPIIASAHCGDVVRDGIDGIVLPDVTGDAIAAAIRRCLDDPALLQGFADATPPGHSVDWLAQRWIEAAA
ncbi:glycosyltransferase family 4 protein [Sphingomonas immobilis]|uniref:Glycosyltransferase family 4 protein n=1 Tax=Sphingomonas immobilis TaxID=3063997 RepID=A0ABT8ZVF7_9SPHN|nr:glycosyltransferase family 4 protein [Sphingomonas sp. CA1-15]MDO7841560.1 glycosyltransferase family 4 protein [Sphingomonas sp. CA1-15]